MALYSFDGTWNEDLEDSNKETNVRKFLQVYTAGTPEENYIEGVGTRFGVIGRVMGGVFGAGGKTRIEEMYEKLVFNWQNGDHEIDIIGFSRGAALAVHFANLVANYGVRFGDSHVTPNIRFLGVWDIVGSFGIPINFVLNFQDVNIGYDISSVDKKIEHCFHAMAMHENRQTFDLTRLNASNQASNVEETWFRGVHTDVGGGQGNSKLANITLVWMLEKAKLSGLPISDDIQEFSDQDATAPLGENFDPIKNDSRIILTTDTIHESARGKNLAIGESAHFIVGSAEKYSWSGIKLEKDAFYTFSIDVGQQWEDGDIKCSPAGWKSEELPWYKKSIVELMEGQRRCPDANWFELIGSLDEGGDIFRIGRGGNHATYQAKKNGTLYAFANDMKALYFNNHGQILVVITKVPASGRVQLSYTTGSDD